jgi:hypothetical protein
MFKRKTMQASHCKSEKQKLAIGVVNRPRYRTPADETRCNDPDEENRYSDKLI